MEFIKIYEEYNIINSEYMEYINTLVNSNIEGCNNDGVKDRLLGFQNKLEFLKIRADVEVVEEKDINNLNDLKYLLMDSLFASCDLVNFYNRNEPERFKMRALNYINKRKRAEIFNESRHSPCRVE